MNIDHLVSAVALAVARAGRNAGQDKATAKRQSASERAANLIRCGYIARPSRPNHKRYLWCDVVIISEEHGGLGDCVPPLSEYHKNTGTTSRVAERLTAKATGTDGGCYLEGLDAVSWGVAYL